MSKGSRSVLSCLLVACLAAGPALAAKAPEGVKTRAGTARYIVVLDDASLVEELRDLERLTPVTASRELRGPRGKLNLGSEVAKARQKDIDARFREFQAEAAATFGRELIPVHRYTAALNGFSVRLTAKEARRLAKMDGVRTVRLDETFKLQTDAGPGWIGAGRVWSGEGPLDPNRGEGVVIGVIDSGVNWDHPSFADPGEGAPVPDPNVYDHENPFGQQLGLCSDAEVGCNDKLVGVYDFVEDDPDTDVVEEFNNGADNGSHGAHVASTAAGNPVAFSFGVGLPRTLSGVAPRANVVSYRVCYAGDPDDFDDDGCQSSAILAAIDQAVTDGVDVINYSVGGGAFDPWVAPDTLAFLNAVEAGIFVATSAGNDGPNAGTMGRPANAPWITAVGSATHNRVLAGVLRNMSGGGTTPPDDLVGTTLTEDGLSQAPIVHASEFGFPLCGTGEPELAASCGANTGASNPFAPGTFNGEIVVCDRGTYGRVEKGKNLLDAGAGGYVLLNTESNGGEITNEDQHCLPATHLSASRGDELRDWLNTGSGHRGSLSGFQVVLDEDFADRMSDFSSRGPNPSPAENVLKPNVMAPGDLIFAAGPTGSQTIALGGTSMASPHVAGAAALLLAANPDLTPAQIASVLELSATDELARDENLGEATHFDTGAGRVRLFESATAGLYLEESPADFRDADPFEGGDPRTLNLASMTDSNCRATCSFTRTVSAFEGGHSWTASSSGFPEGVVVTVTPDSFDLAANAGQQIEVTVDWSQADVAGQWLFGKVHIDSGGFPTASLPVSVFASIGELPAEWGISTSKSSGFEDFELSGLGELPQATFSTGGLIPAEEITVDLVEDATWEDPFDGSEGTVTLLYDVPADTLWFHTDTPPSASEDVDLFVGFDSNNDGVAQESELVCLSATFEDVEFCDIFTPDQGVWWVVIQNWEDGFDEAPGEGPAQAVTLVSTLVVNDEEANLVATGPGMADPLDDLEVRLTWNDVNVPTGRTLYGAVGISSTSDANIDVGVIPVVLDRLGVALPETRALFSGKETAFALRANTSHQELFIDVPPGAVSLDVSVAGGDAAQNNNLEVDLVPVSFNQAFGAAPDAGGPGNAGSAVSAAGNNGQGPTVSIEDSVDPGRWYVVVTNNGNNPAAVRVTATLTHEGTPIPVYGGLWEPASRPGINQGFEYTPAGPVNAFLWYTYDRDGSPTWYIAAESTAMGNTWTADLFRYTNDGVTQHGTQVGTVSITQLDESDAVLTWTLYGESGSDRVTPLSRACPEVNDPPVSYTGLWFRGVDGLGGASVLADVNQAFIHYLYDGDGRPRWLLAAGGFETDEMVLEQFSGYCPTCSGSVSSESVGVLEVTFDDNTEGEWSLDYEFLPPASGGDQRTESIIKLSDNLACSN